MIETIRRYLCHDCESDHAVMEVIHGKIKLDMCNDCIDKKEEQTEFSFNELDEKAKAFAVHMKMKGGFVDFDVAWEELERSDLNFDSEGSIYE